MLSYALKRIVRSWKLFAALILGMMLAGTFFGGINVGADTVGKQVLDQQLASTPVDVRIGEYYYGSSASTLERVASEVGRVDGVTAAEPRGNMGVWFNVSSATLRAIPDNSILYDHITILEGGRPLQQDNETLINVNSDLADKYPVGTTLNYTLHYGQYGNLTLPLSFKIVGIASLDKTAALTLGAPEFYESGGIIIPQTPQSILIVSWEQTYKRLADWAGQQFRYEISSYVDVNLDRDRLITPWDIEGSVAKIEQVQAEISRIAVQNGIGSTRNYLLEGIGSFGPGLLSLRATFIVFSIPVFFMAWYVGRTVSNASYNLRRREIGLLMTKGFAKGQLFRHFLVEAIIVGLISGVLGLALAVILSPLIIQTLSGTNQGIALLSTSTAIATIIFTAILTFLSVLSPARQASGMDPAKALREYVYVEDVKASRKTFAWVAFFLGLYKIILLLLGINFITLGRAVSGSGFFFALVLIIMTVLDFVLTFIGPFLFLYGATQLSTGLAARFHRLFTRLSRRLVGDIATLASNSVFRNPRRVASLVFLVALIAGYSFWVTGDLASMEDYNIRQAKTRVGADISITGVSSLSNASAIATSLRTWSNVTAVAIEQEIGGDLLVSGGARLRAIDPSTWGDAAYYEPEWFSGNLDTILETFSSDTTSILLDRGIASRYRIDQGDFLTLSPQLSLSVNVIGFFGPDYSQSSTPGIIVGPIGTSFFYAQGWSYVPQNLIPQGFFATTNRVLVKAAPGVFLTELGLSIRQAFPYATVEISQASTQTSFGAFLGGALNILRLGTVFAAAAACIGVGAVSYTGFKEREKETTMVAVRGFSYRKVLGLLVTEVLPLVLFALILASIVGLITVRGDILALNTQSFSFDYYSILSPRRLVFPQPAQLTLLTIYGLLVLGVFVPAIVFARKDLSKISRTVRFA